MLSTSPADRVVVMPTRELSPLAVDLATACKLAGGISDRHLRKFFPDGAPEYVPKLPVCRIGGRLTIRVAALEKWLAQVEQSAAES